MKRWDTNARWPDVPELHLEMVRRDAVAQMRGHLGHTLDRVQLASRVNGEVMDELRGKLEEAPVQWVWDVMRPIERADAGRRIVVDMFRPHDRREPPERWWWTPLGILCVAQHTDEGAWTARSSGRVPAWVKPSLVSAHLPITDRTVRRWGELDGFRTKGRLTEGRHIVVNRTDAARMVLMRYPLVYR